ncbi:hypothetical protein KQI58_03630 [Enterococcus raffinosus]|nr:hypothetical protein [Enterococcus raffinosus]
MTDIYLTAEPNDVLRRFSSIFKPYFKKSGDWDTVIQRLFTNKKEYHQSSERFRLAVKYLYAVNMPKDERDENSYNLISVFKDANGKKHKWTLKDVDPEKTDEETATLLKLLTELSIFKNKEVRQFAQLMTFDYFKTANIRHYEEPQEDQLETSVEKNIEEGREKLEIMVPHGFDPRTLSETELMVLVQAYLPEGKTISDVHVFFIERPAEFPEDEESQPAPLLASEHITKNLPEPAEETSPENQAAVGIAVPQEKAPKKSRSNNIGHLSGSQLSAMSLIDKSKNKEKQTSNTAKSSTKKTKKDKNSSSRKRKRGKNKK